MELCDGAGGPASKDDKVAFQELVKGGGLLRDGLLNGVECRMLFVAIHERFSCKVSSLESCVRNSGFQQSRNMN